MNPGEARQLVRGLYAVTPDGAATGRLLDQVRTALQGGARLVQYRNKSDDSQVKLEQARALQALCSEHAAAFIVNDDVAIAAASGAAGVHLGRDDGSLAHARAALGPGKLIGISCYDDLGLARAAAKAGADYVAFGSFFPSRVKPGAVRASLALLESAKRELALPIVAIGGITSANGGALVRAGADALAVISALFDEPDVAAAAARFTPLFD